MIHVYLVIQNQSKKADEMESRSLVSTVSLDGYLYKQRVFSHKLIPVLPSGAVKPTPLVGLEQQYQDSQCSSESSEEDRRKTRSQGVCTGVATVTHPDRVVPASGRHRPAVCGAGTTHPLPTGPAVVLGHDWSEGFRALVALGDVLVGYPVVWPSHVLHKTERVIHSCGDHVQRGLSHLRHPASDQTSRLHLTHLAVSVSRSSLAVAGLAHPDRTAAPAPLRHRHPVAGAGMAEPLPA